MWFLLVLGKKSGSGGAEGGGQGDGPGKQPPAGDHDPFIAKCVWFF